MNRFGMFLLIFTFLISFLWVRAYQEPQSNVSELLGKAEQKLKQHSIVQDVASSYTGYEERLIRFRIVVKEHVKKEEAESLVADFLFTSAGESHGSNVWDENDLEFDILHADKGIIFKGSKKRDETTIAWH